MPRIRSIKPDFFVDEDVARLEPLDRITFIGLWTQADKAGRMEYRPKRLQIQILPYDSGEFCHRLQRLEEAGFIIRYIVNGKEYLWIRTFEKHQRPHNTEAPSSIPPYNGEITVRQPLDVQEITSPLGREGKGREGKGKNSVGFEELWKAFPPPKGPKQDALKAFKEVEPPENVVPLLQVQISYKQSCDTRGEFCPQLPHLHRWLKKRRWEDEIPTAEKPIEYPKLEDPKTAWQTKERYLEARAAGRVSPRERVAEWEPTASPA